MQPVNLTQEWDKKFPQSDKVNHRKVMFKNRYGITLAADLYEPKNADGKLAAIAENEIPDKLVSIVQYSRYKITRSLETRFCGKDKFKGSCGIRIVDSP